MDWLAGKSAIVTGSTSGIGLGVAETLAAAGARVMLSGFGDPDAIEGIRRRLSGPNPHHVQYHDADLTIPDQVVGLVEAANRAFGGVDILVNNAGVQHVAPIAEFPADRWDYVIALNLSAAFHAMKAVLPGMLERGWGRIINIASAHGLVASVNKSAYVASKHGLVGLTKVAALETAETGVTVNAIAPGWVLTPLVEAQIHARARIEGKSFDEARRDLLAEKQPSRQFVTPSQIGELVAFLCSPAADQIRGQAIGIDGGWTAQ
ncbi:MAG: 3-hydroxybutyrate dehydrogenase [Isosphaeraceae bacterium]